MKTFSLEELEKYDGRNDTPIYVACDGIVYDVSESKRWKNGRHMQRHTAGADLTADIQAAPHKPDLLDRFPQVGTLLKEEAPSRPMPAWLRWLMTANPFLRRHPHPMTVHFPIVFLLSHPLFILLFLITGNTSFETTAYHCLGCGILATAVAIATGFFTWWYNYMAKLMPAVMIKITLSAAALVLAAVLFFWRAAAPEILTAPETFNISYVWLSLGLIPLVGIIGWFGATLTFPIEKS